MRLFLLLLALPLLALRWLLGSYALNNSSVSSTNVTFSCSGAVKVGVLVANAPVLMTPTFRDIAGNTTAGAQAYLAPGFYTFRRPIEQLVFIQAVSGQTALVTCEALKLSESNQ